MKVYVTGKSPAIRLEGVTDALARAFSVIMNLYVYDQSSTVFPPGVNVLTVIYPVNGLVAVGF